MMYEQMQGCFEDLLMVLITEIPLEDIPAADLGPFFGFFWV